LKIGSCDVFSESCINTSTTTAQQHSNTTRTSAHPHIKPMRRIGLLAAIEPGLTSAKKIWTGGDKEIEHDRAEKFYICIRRKRK
jgi:adenosylmethionine-8-amino-7-oxononanoate aminotransferase